MLTSQIITLLFAAATNALPIPSSSLSNQAAAPNNLFLEIRRPSKTPEEKAARAAKREARKAKKAEHAAKVAEKAAPVEEPAPEAAVEETTEE